MTRLLLVCCALLLATAGCAGPLAEATRDLHRDPDAPAVLVAYATALHTAVARGDRRAACPQLADAAHLHDRLADQAPVAPAVYTLGRAVQALKAVCPEADQLPLRLVLAVYETRSDDGQAPRQVPYHGDEVLVERLNLDCSRGDDDAHAPRGAKVFPLIHDPTQVRGPTRRVYAWPRGCRTAFPEATHFVVGNALDCRAGAADVPLASPRWGARNTVELAVVLQCVR